MDAKVETDGYETLDQFSADVQLMFWNCRTYNDASTPYVKCANRLEKFFKEKLKDWNIGLA
ncbi:MAG: nucleosome-remodeling factor subunit BPTF-like protein [Olpidium bornovanus]|uniref:Nucleosome-remodeling factor subunit BPTF-like protein n=1 Tax=Olpidium bornovanus TaxID=278681 RepID=A0A8H8DJC5_9FUNG|nr:MAG: nucleosome-remodeling factor subunit BPTF-like protein [Olpidium bornovanus]